MFRLPFDIYPYIRPLIFLLDPEDAHAVAIKCLQKDFFPATDACADPVLEMTLNGISFPHPIGLAAGFDKQGDVIGQLFKLGFSHAEIGGVTPFPQDGNPKPRMFRIPESKAVINRFNFNSIGYEAFRRRLQAWHDESIRQNPRPIVGINISRGDNCADDAQAYISGIQHFAPYVRYIALNISCPNECGARHIESPENLKSFLEKVKSARDALDDKPLLWLKISPDQTEDQAKKIAETCLETGIDGIIIGNTTTTRPKTLPPEQAKEAGGLSGKPLFEMSTRLLGWMYQLTQGKIPLIGCGGVSSGADAYEKIRSGASLVQIYTAIVYEGPAVVAHITEELAYLLKRDGFTCVTDAVGSKFRTPNNA